MWNCRFMRFLCLVLLIAGLVGCEKNNMQFGFKSHQQKYMFPEGKRWGKASKRRYKDGQLIPSGGGHFKTGKPYRVNGRTYYPERSPSRGRQVGTASWYGIAFHGRETANGEVYDRMRLSAAHPTMPLPSYARVTNLRNGRSVVVRVNNRGPFIGKRIIDLSEMAAHVLGFRDIGLARVMVQYVAPAHLSGSDQGKLLATFRTGKAFRYRQVIRNPVMKNRGIDHLFAKLVVPRKPESKAVLFARRNAGKIVKTRSASSRSYAKSSGADGRRYWLGKKRKERPKDKPRRISGVLWEYWAGSDGDA